MAVNRRLRTDLPNDELSGGAYTVTNFTADRDFDAGSSSNEVLGDVLASVIQDLIAQGILRGTLAA